MASRSIIMTMAKENNGYVMASSVRKLGIDTKILQRMTALGELERVAHGLYLSADYMEDPFFVALYRCPMGTYSMNTALFLHHLTDRNSYQMCMTIPSGTNTALLKEPGFRFFYLASEQWALGRTSIPTPFGNAVSVYDLERTLVDCVRKIDVLDRDEVLSAIKSYARLKNKDSSKLLAYAETFHIREQVWRYLEVLS
jgi:predicted transcriptional regulator of viral defense system